MKQQGIITVKSNTTPSGVLQEQKPVEVVKRKLVVSDNEDEEEKEKENPDSDNSQKDAFKTMKETPIKKLKSDIVHEKKVEKTQQEVKAVQPKLEIDLKSTGTPTPFGDLCSVFESIEATSKRLIILDLLTKFMLTIFKQKPNELLPIVYLCTNRLSPTWEGLELGIGETVLMKAIASATGRSLNKIKQELSELGDLGKVAESSRSCQPTMFKPKPLTIVSCFDTLKEIANISGHQSMQKKIEKIKFLLVSCQDKEAKFLMRLLEGKLRIGLAEQTVLMALAHAAVLSQHSDRIQERQQQAVEILKQVYSEVPNYESIIPVLVKYPIEELPEHCQMTPGIPLKPMLAHPTKSIHEVLNRFEGVEFTCEYKYDGERAQIHLLPSGEIQVYSRNQEHVTQKYPDVIQNLPQCFLQVNSFIMDCECVAWDLKQEKILPFQVLSTRKRKDVQVEDVKVRVCLFAFDLLYLNGQPLIRKTLDERRQLLQKYFQPVKSVFQFATYQNCSSLEEIQTFLDASIEGNCEGLMVKTLKQESSYEPSKRSRNWLKVKKDYLEGVGDSLDLVVVGGYLGKGKRVGNYGGFLLACFDPDREEYQVICKLGTGFSDEFLVVQSQALRQKAITEPKSYYRYTEGVKPDIWFEPSQVWEIKTADLSISPTYTAAVGLVDPTKGISLRFPRFIRVREDKSVEEATTSQQVADMFMNQKMNHDLGGAEQEEAEDW